MEPYQPDAGQKRYVKRRTRKPLAHHGGLGQMSRAQRRAGRLAALAVLPVEDVKRPATFRPDASGERVREPGRARLPDRPGAARDEPRRVLAERIPERPTRNTPATLAPWLQEPAQPRR